jgi:hypothetical protein
LLFLLQVKEKAKENFSLFIHKVEASLATLIERNKSLKETRTQQMTLQLDVMPDVKPLLHALKSDSVKLNELSVILESLKLPELYQRFPQAVEYFNSLRDECKSFLEKTVKIFLDLKKVSLDVVSLAKDYAALQTQLDQESIPSAQLTVDTLTAKVELLKSKAKELSDQKAEDVVVQPEKVKKHTSRQKVTSDMFFSPDDKSARASHTHQSLRERMKKYLPPEHEQQADLQNLLKAKSEPLPVQTEPAQPQSSAKPGGFKEFGAFGESHKKAKESAHSSKKDKKKTEKGASKTPYK